MLYIKKYYGNVILSLYKHIHTNYTKLRFYTCINEKIVSTQHSIL